MHGTYQSLLVPLNTGLLVGVGVGVALNGTGLTAKQTVELGADLVGAVGLDSVALRATGLSRRLATALRDDDVYRIHIKLTLKRLAPLLASPVAAVGSAFCLIFSVSPASSSCASRSAMTIDIHAVSIDNGSSSVVTGFAL